MKNKIKLLILLLVAVAGIGLYYLYTSKKTEVLPEESNGELVEEVKPTPIEMTEEQEQQYYQIYENPYVIHIRTAIDGYLDGTNEGIHSPAVVVESKQEKDGSLSGLDSFKDYIEGKFIVLAINDGAMGGKIINIMFQDKPDKIFWTWVYKEVPENYDLRGFKENLNFSPDQIETTQILFKNYLEDKEHSL